MKAIAVLSFIALASLVGCVKEISQPIGQAQTTSGTICPQGSTLDENGQCVVAQPPPAEFDVP